MPQGLGNNEDRQRLCGRTTSVLARVVSRCDSVAIWQAINASACGDRCVDSTAGKPCVINLYIL